MIYTYTHKQLSAGTALTASAVTQYTVPDSTTTIVKQIVFCNTDTSARTVTVYAIPSGGSAAAANTIFSAMSLQPGETKVIPMEMVLPTGAFIQALASSASVVSMRVSGIERM